MGNGRVISIRHQPIAGGGWVATHQDVTDEIARAEELQLQRIRLEDALNNMTQGLCMFDRDKRLVLSNRRYAELYDLPPDAMQPGLDLHSILRQRVQAGNLPVDGATAFLDNHLNVATDGKPCAFDVEMTNGRVISIRHQPTASGGWVATHEDVTEQRRHLARIRYLATHDVLTDLPNRVVLQKSLNQVKTRVHCGEMVGLLRVDLDLLKR